MKTYIIIVTYNGEKWIQKCLSSVMKSDIKHNIIVIDNASNDNTSNIIKDYFPEVELIENTENIGFGRANNIGIKKAYDESADFIFLLNQDAYVEKDTIRKLVNIAKSNQNFGIISPVHLNGNGDALDFNFSNYIVPRHCQGFYSDLYLNNLSDSVYQVKFVNAAAWLISRQCIETIGGFNPIFDMYGEDDNYIHRVYYHGFMVGIYPFARIFHDRSQMNISTYFTDKKMVLKRDFIINNCNIHNHFNTKNLCKEYLILIFKALLKFDFYSFNIHKYKLSLLISYNKEIHHTRIKSKQKGQTFLSI